MIKLEKTKGLVVVDEKFNETVLFIHDYGYVLEHVKNEIAADLKIIEEGRERLFDEGITIRQEMKEDPNIKALPIEDREKVINLELRKHSAGINTLYDTFRDKWKMFDGQQIPTVDQLYVREFECISEHDIPVPVEPEES